MSYDSWDEQSVRSLYLDEWPLSCCNSSCSQLHTSALRLGAHGRDLENFISYVMEIEENKLEKESSGSQAQYVHY